MTCSAGERERRFEIRLDDRAIADVALDGREPDRFIDVTYPILGISWRRPPTARSP